MRLRRGAVVSATVAAAALVLAGCTAAPARTHTPSSPPQLSSLTVGPDGLSGLPVARPVPADSALAHFGEHTCPKTGGWIPAYPESADDSSGQPLHPFDIVTAGSRRTGPITDEYIWSKAIATSRGIAVGSSEAQVRAAYPSATTTASYSTEVYAVTGVGGKLLIEVALHNSNAAGEWPSTILGTVVWMHVVRPVDKVVSIADNDNGGACPVKGKDPGDTDDDDDD